MGARLLPFSIGAAPPDIRRLKALRQLGSALEETPEYSGTVGLAISDMQLHRWGDVVQRHRNDVWREQGAAREGDKRYRQRQDDQGNRRGQTARLEFGLDPDPVSLGIVLEN